jgi:cation:H+ antiporter
MTALYLIAGVFFLYVGAEALVRGGAALALRLGVTPLIIGLTVISFGTSSPELLVSFRAAMLDNSAMALGNVIGSNIANIALVLGLTALVRPLRVERQVVRRDIPFMLIASVLMALLLLDGHLARWEGGLLFAGLIAYLIYSIRHARGDEAATRVTPPEGDRGPALNLVLVIAGLIGLAFGANWFVTGAVHVANYFGVSPLVIGLTVVAVGTSLPEIAASLVAGLKGEGDMAVGNAIGSNIFNVLFILGFTALWFGIDAGDLRWEDLAVMLGLSAASLPIMRRDLCISRLEGAALLIAYAAYLVFLVQRAA